MPVLCDGTIGRLSNGKKGKKGVGARWGMERGNTE